MITASTIYDAVCEAEQRIRPHIRKTPVEPAYILSQRTGWEVFLKAECLQFTRSFKLRGALNKLAALGPKRRAKGVITASTGNHGLAVAYASQQFACQASIFLPETVAERKVRLMQRFPVQIERVGEDPVEAELAAREASAQLGIPYLSPYNDPDIVAGQGTLGHESMDQLKHCDAVFIPVGGGGLISGIAGYLKAAYPAVRVIGCQPVNAAAMKASVEAGQVVEIPYVETLSDGTSGGIEPGAITLDLCSRFVDDWVLVEEEAIRNAMITIYEETGLVVEGAAGLGVAALQQYAQSGALERGARVLSILCGGNIELNQYCRLVAE